MLLTISHTLSGVRDVDHMTPAHHACWRGHKEVIKFLVEELHCDVGESVYSVKA